MKFVGVSIPGFTGGMISISHELIVPVEVFPASSVDVTFTGPTLGIGLGVIEYVPLPLTTHVPTSDPLAL